MLTVTGGLGFIGSHLVDALAAQGHQITVIDDYRWGKTGFTGDRPLPAFAQEWPRRVCLEVQPVSHANIPPSTVIYHLAGPVGPVGVLEYAGRLAHEVVSDAHGLAQRAMRVGARLIYVSTSEVYGAQEWPTTEAAPRIIESGHSARMEYAVAKLAAETMLLNTLGLDVRIIRPFNVAGPRQRAEGGFVLPRFLEQAQTGKPLTVYGDGSATRAFTHVADIVDGIIRAATQGIPGGVYNLGNPDNACTIAQLAADVIAITKSESGIEYVDPVALWGEGFREAPDKVPDITRARAKLGWNPTLTREQIIRDAAA
jgi:nucleoside-diphosphate-sugar epimerase